MFETISVKEALNLAYEGKGILYDIRDEYSYRKGHLPMAEKIEKEYVEEELKRIRREGKRTELIIFYCDYGNQSMLLARHLSEKGHKRIASMIGGYHAYELYVEALKKEFWTMEWKERG